MGSLLRLYVCVRGSSHIPYGGSPPQKILCLCSSSLLLPCFCGYESEYPRTISLVPPDDFSSTPGHFFSEFGTVTGVQGIITTLIRLMKLSATRYASWQPGACYSLCEHRAYGRPTRPRSLPCNGSTSKTNLLTHVPSKASSLRLPKIAPCIGNSLISSLPIFLPKRLGPGSGSSW